MQDRRRDELQKHRKQDLKRGRMFVSQCEREALTGGKEGRRRNDETEAQMKV